MRLTAVLIVVFFVSSLLSFGAAYWVVRSGFEAALGQQLDQSFDAYTALGNPRELVERLTLDAAATDPETEILAYVPDRGPRISNVRSFPEVSGQAVVSADAVSGDGLADSYLAGSGRVGPGQLTVAHTREQIVELGEVFVTVFLTGLVPTLFIAATAGLLVARDARRKIDAIRDTLSAITVGKLSARVAVADAERDLGQIGESVNRMARAQEASVASLRQVSADIAHDLKTPIQRVAVILDRLSADTALSTDQDVLVGQALAETDRVAKTFQALLQIAQIEGGAVQDRFGVIDLKRVASDFVELYAASAEETGHRVELRMSAAEGFDVLGDRHLLGQVVANLIENGLRHVPDGGDIIVGLAREKTQVVLAVSDNGPGIPEGERENVLRRLYRLERSRTTDGNGLGLSLVAAVCDLHAATLTFEDNTPGLSVRIVFPEVSRQRKSEVSIEAQG